MNASTCANTGDVSKDQGLGHLRLTARAVALYSSFHFSPASTPCGCSTHCSVHVLVLGWCETFTSASQRVRSVITMGVHASIRKAVTRVCVCATKSLRTCLSDTMTLSTSPLNTSDRVMCAQQREMISLDSLRSNT